MYVWISAEVVARVDDIIYWADVFNVRPYFVATRFLLKNTKISLKDASLFIKDRVAEFNERR